MNRLSAPARRDMPSWLAKTVTTISNWLTVGPNPKIRDPQNSSDRYGSSASGMCVNDQTALGNSAFFACLRTVSSTGGALPLPVYRTDSKGVAIEARDAPLWNVLHDSPNADQTALDYWEFVFVSLLMRGNHFARKLKEGPRLIGLDPVRPDIVSVRRREDGRIGYRWSWDRQSFDLTEDDVFHIRGFGGGPLGGLSVLAYARESLGVAIAADRAAGSMFANGAMPSGALKFKEWLDADKRKEQRDDIEERFTGTMNAGRPFILEGGSEWQQISLKADDAQLLQSRSWSVEEICRWFGVPPPMIGHAGTATNWPTGVEQQVLNFVKFTLTPYLRRIEQSIKKQLLTPAERAQGMFAEFNLEGLLRGDSQGRMNFYRGMTQIGAMTRNEVRAKENLPPIDGGDVVTIQSQNVPLEQLIADAAAAGLPKQGD